MKNPYTRKVTERFIQAANTIIYENKRAGKEPSNMTQFAVSIGQLPQNVSKLFNKDQHTSTQILEATIRIHGVNPTWLFLNKGEMFLKDEGGEDIVSLARQLRTIAAKLEALKKAK